MQIKPRANMGIGLIALSMIFFFNADFIAEFFLELKSRLNIFNCPAHCVDNNIFRNFVCTSFDHDNFMVFNCDNEVEI